VKKPAVAAAEKHQGAALSKAPFVLVGGSKPPPPWASTDLQNPILDALPNRWSN
jgi:hypothetical protein